MSPLVRLAAVAVLSLAAPAHAAPKVHGVSIELADRSDARMVRLGIQRDIARSWFRSERHHLGAYWDLTVAAWRADAWRDQPGVRRRLWDIGLTPVFRYQRNERIGWYGEAGIGVHYLSDYYHNGNDQLSTRFQFGDHLGLGYVFGNGVDVAAKFQHFSNGGIRKPNVGANFLIVKAAMRF